jgi:hypothetical protein
MGAFSGRMDAGIGRRCEEFLCVGGGGGAAEIHGVGWTGV